MKAYKGFDKNLRCRDFQYELGKTYEEKEARICATGFHACENPLNVLQYYPPCYGNRYCKVEQYGELSESDSDSKIASTNIKINKEISLTELIQAAIDKSGESEICSINTGVRTVAENAESYSMALNKGYGSIAANTGDCSLATTATSASIAANTGDYSVAYSQEAHSIAANTGDDSATLSKGYRSIAANTGDNSVIMDYGESSVAVSVGNQSAAINNGGTSVALNTGFYAEASVQNENSIAIATGVRSKAKAGLGSAIVLVERGTWDDHAYPLSNIKAAIVDGKIIKADTWYTLRNGELVECEEGVQ